MSKNIKTKTQPITSSSKFSDLGIDSLDSVELVVEMEREFGLDLSNDEAHEILSVDKAISTFFRHLNAQIANKMVEQAQVETGVQ